MSRSLPTLAWGPPASPAAEPHRPPASPAAEPAPGGGAHAPIGGVSPASPPDNSQGLGEGQGDRPPQRQLSSHALPFGGSAPCV